MITRERLKQAALRLFLKNGYAGTTIAAIETAAGLAPRAGGFYRHFQSKEELVVVIAREEIIEQEEELGFTDLMPLGSTYAELMLMARGYLRANKRQAKYYALIQEVRQLPAIAAFEQTANDDLFSTLKDWVASKPAAKSMSGKECASFTMMVFGGLLFYFSKRLDGVELPTLGDEQMVTAWADYWAPVLDTAARSKRSVRRAS